MPNYLRAYAERAATPAEPGTPIRFVASTAKVGRDGLIIDQEGWQLDNFRANPGFLWHHDYSGQRPPIGRVDSVSIEGGKLVADVTFDQGDPFAVDVERKYRDGFMNAVSVGWDTLEVQPPKGDGPARVTRAELLDISAVNIPGDPHALIERQKRAMQEALAALETPTEPNPTDSASMSWDDAVTAMVSLNLPGLQRPETERKAEYARVKRAYAAHGKTAPEFVDAERLAAFDLSDARGLFLEGEAERLPGLFGRAGAVLSKRNADDLASAVSLIQGVIERATKEPATADSTETPKDEPRGVDPTIARLHELITKGKTK